MNIIQKVSTIFKDLYWIDLLLVVVLAACQEAPVSDKDLFSQQPVPINVLEQYVDTAKMIPIIDALPQKHQQVDTHSQELRQYSTTQRSIDLSELCH